MTLTIAEAERQAKKLAKIVFQRARGRQWSRIAKLIGGSPRYDLQDYSDVDAGEAPKEDVKPAQTRQTAPGRKPFVKPEKDPKAEEMARKDRIMALLKKLELPCKTKKECEDSVFTATGLMLAPENYEQIGDALAKELQAEK